MINFLGTAIELILRIWGWVSGRSREQLNKKRKELEEVSRQAQLDGDLDELRKARAEIEEIDRRLSIGDY